MAERRQPTLADVATMARLVQNHIKAGHDLTNRKLVTDLTTLEFNVDAVLDTIRTPATNRERLIYLIHASKRIEAQQKEFLVSLATDIAAAAAETGRSATEAAARVTAAIGTLRTDLAAAVAKIEELIAAGPSPEDTAALEAALADIQAADATVDSIEAAPAPEPEPEPEPEP